MRILQQLPNELSFTDENCPAWVATTSGILNNVSTPSRGHKTPNELFWGTTVSALLTSKVKFVDKSTQILVVEEEIMDMNTEFQREWITLREDASNTYKMIDLAREVKNERKNKSIPLNQFRPGD